MVEINGMTGTVTRDSANAFQINGVSADPQETTGGTVTIITRNGISYGLESSSITGFPEEYYRAPILYACIKVLQELIHTDTDTLNTLIVTDEDPELAVLQQQKIDGRLKQQQLLQAEYEQIFMPYQMPSKEEKQEGARQ